MKKSELEIALVSEVEKRGQAEDDIINSGLLIDDQKQRIEQLSKEKADLLADLIQYRTTTFRLHESNAALLTLISKHKI